MRQAYSFKGKARDLHTAINQWMIEKVIEEQRRLNQQSLVAEVKLKRHGYTWEQTPIHEFIDPLTTHMDAAREFLDRYARHLATLHDTEVRWSFIEIGQGHYIHPKMDYETPLKLLY